MTNIITSRFKKYLAVFLLFPFFYNPMQGQEQLEVDGAIKINNSSNNPEMAGTIRWNPSSNDFEGYDGTEWLSLTKNNTSGSTGTDSLGSNFGLGLCLENQKLFIPGANGADGFGFSISIDSNWAIIGAPFSAVDGQIDQGAAYIYKYENCLWSIADTLHGSDSQNYDSFGYSVGISGNYAIVGAKDAGTVGKVYYFERTGNQWSETQKVFAPNVDDGQFGYSVSIDGNYSIISAYLGNIGPNIDQGRAYIYFYNGSFWAFQADLTASNGAADDQFGSSVKLKNDIAVIAAEVKDGGGFDDRGTVYVFERNGINWSEIDILEPPVSLAFQYFGRSIDYDGKTILISDLGSSIISGYYYKDNDGWSLTNQVTATSNQDGGASAIYCDQSILYLTGLCQTANGWKSNKFFSNSGTLFQGEEAFAEEIDMNSTSVFVGSWSNGCVWIYTVK